MIVLLKPKETNIDDNTKTTVHYKKKKKKKIPKWHFLGASK